MDIYCLLPLTKSLNLSGFMDLQSFKRVLCENSISHDFKAFCTVSSSDPFGQSCKLRATINREGDEKGGGLKTIYPSTCTLVLPSSNSLSTLSNVGGPPCLHSVLFSPSPYKKDLYLFPILLASAASSRVAMSSK